MLRTTKREERPFQRTRASTCALLITAVTVALPGASVLAEGSASRPADDAMPADYAKGVELVSAGEFAQARREFARANTKKRNNPEILNMLAYTQRKTGSLDESIATYKRALALRPDFPEAREYLGEAHLQAALEQLTWLEEAGAPAKDQHAALLRAIRDGTRGLPADPKVSSRW